MLNRSRYLLAIACALPAMALCATRTHASSGDRLLMPIASNGPRTNERVSVKLDRARLPFPINPVENAAANSPQSAMSDSAMELAQVRAYVSRSLADSPNFSKAYASVTALDARTDYRRECSDRVHMILKGDPSRKEIALTFDDGPHGAKSLALVRELAGLHVKATFFLVGKQAVKFPQIVQLEVVEGNEVGNHTFDHVNLTKIPASMVPYELDECDAVIKHIIGTSPRFFRPPGGDVDMNVVRAAAAHGYITTLWTDDPGDYKLLPSSEILHRCLMHLKPGGIVLLHDGIPETMQMLPQFVAAARREGYTFVTMSQLADGRRIVP